MPVTVENDIGPGLNMIGCLDPLDPIAFGRSGNFIVKACPVSSVILGKLDIAIACSYPDEAGFEWRFIDRHDRAVPGFWIRREVRTDHLPVITTVDGFEQLISPEIECVGIVRRNDQTGLRDKCRVDEVLTISM